MNKLIILLFFTFTSTTTFSQKKGTYKGLFTPKNQFYPITSQRDTIIDGEKTTQFYFEKPEWNSEKKLVLFNKGIFHFEYSEGCYAFASRDQRQSCKGIYKINRDTLFLTSTNKQSDYYSVTEEIIDTIPEGKIMIVTNYPNRQLFPNTFINGFDLQLNDTLIGEFRINDTIYCKTNDVKKLIFSCCSPYPMEWSYAPKSKETNFFNITLIREINGDNIFMNNTKFLIKKNKLIVIEGNQYLSVKDGLFIND